MTDLITMTPPSLWPFPTGVVPPEVTQSGTGYIASSGGQVTVKPIDVGALVNLGFTPGLSVEQVTATDAGYQLTAQLNVIVAGGTTGVVILPPARAGATCIVIETQPNDADLTTVELHGSDTVLQSGSAPPFVMGTNGKAFSLSFYGVAPGIWTVTTGGAYGVI